MTWFLSYAAAVAPAGFAQTAPGAASPCAKSEYAPQFNRLARCLRCQSGLEEPTDSGLAYAQRSNKKDVCSEFGATACVTVMHADRCKVVGSLFGSREGL